MRERHVPVRTCVGCRERRPKTDLVRFVLGGEGVHLGSIAGRGMYVCRNLACVERALRRRGLKDLCVKLGDDRGIAGLRQAVTSRPNARDETGGRHTSCSMSGGSAIG